MLQIIDSVGSVGEGIEHGGLGLRHEEHVALVDRLPAANAGAVEAQAVLEDVFVQLVHRNREVLPDAREVHESQVDRLDIFFPAQRQNFFRFHDVPFTFDRFQKD